jgi:hypothetical protein
VLGAITATAYAPLIHQLVTAASINLLWKTKLENHPEFGINQEHGQNRN